VAYFSFLEEFKNAATDYLLKRLQDPKYRGRHLMQHYRYDFDDISKILEVLNKYAPDKKLMPIRTTDLSKESDDSKWKDYALFCDKVKRKIGKGTQDSIRKNLFVDLARMGLICRYNEEKKPNDPYDKKNVNAFVSLTDDGLRVINAENELNKGFIMSKAIDNKFLKGSMNDLLEILPEANGIIDIYEYMFFITAIGFESKFILTRTKAIDFIKEYRKLDRSEKERITKELKRIMKPDKKDKKGKDKRDFQNWKNETDAIFEILRQTVYFNLRGTKHKIVELSTGKNGLFDEEQKVLHRSLQEKQKYMYKHKIKKIGNDELFPFELHHIVPLSWAVSKEHLLMLGNIIL